MRTYFFLRYKLDIESGLLGATFHISHNAYFSPRKVGFPFRFGAQLLWGRVVLWMLYGSMYTRHQNGVRSILAPNLKLRIIAIVDWICMML